ncbi:MAG: AbrB/MazE/SpoVT family DNA-binding domain-containing protein [Verrucomicrobiia bacterium]|jgi:AbrB family looped-hinge helix DNA binding protein
MHIAYVTSKGQLAIPVKLRRKYNIKKGTRVNFIEANGKIVMQPVTREYIESFCGIFKRKPGSKPVTQELIEEHAEEVRREEEKIARHGF